MTTLTRELKDQNSVTRQDVVALLEKLPTDRPLPDTPEIREAVVELIAELYGDVLQELERH